MLNKMRKLLKSQKGFSFLEIVMCLAILLILFALAVPSINGAKTQTKIFADKSSVEVINNAIAMHTVVNDLPSLVGQTSINCPIPLKNGDSVTVILQFLKDKGLLEEKCVIYNPLGKSYNAVENRVN